MYDKIKEISISCQSSAEECRKVPEKMKRLLRQNWIETFWQQWILQQMRIQISQSEDNAAVLRSHAVRQNSKVSTTTQTQEAYSCMPRPGNVKSTRLSTESVRSQSSSPASSLGLAECYKKPPCQLFSFIQSENVRENTSKEVSNKTISASARSLISSSFQSSMTTKNSSFQNYMYRLPAFAWPEQNKRQGKVAMTDEKEIAAVIMIGAIHRPGEVGKDHYCHRNMCVYSVAKLINSELTTDAILLCSILVASTAPQLQPPT